MQETGSEIDVGAILASGGSPFGIIEDKVKSLAPGESVTFLAPFEPTPLYQHFGAWGVAHEVEKTETGFRIVVRKEEGASDVGVPRFMDLRNLPPPEPLTRTVRAYHELNDGECLIVHVPHRPIHLLDHLDSVGVSWEEQAQPDGSFHIYMMKGVPE